MSSSRRIGEGHPPGSGARKAASVCVACVHHAQRGSRVGGNIDAPRDSAWSDGERTRYSREITTGRGGLRSSTPACRRRYTEDRRGAQNPGSPGGRERSKWPDLAHLRDLRGASVGRWWQHHRFDVMWSSGRASSAAAKRRVASASCWCRRAKLATGARELRFAQAGNQVSPASVADVAAGRAAEGVATFPKHREPTPTSDVPRVVSWRWRTPTSFFGSSTVQSPGRIALRRRIHAAGAAFWRYSFLSFVGVGRDRLRRGDAAEERSDRGLRNRAFRAAEGRRRVWRSFGSRTQWRATVSGIGVSNR